MADDVQITVGIALDQLNRSVEDAKAKFGEFREAIETIIVGGALGLFVDKMTELATQIERSATILGISTSSFQELGLMAKITGGSTEQMTTSLERMQLSAERAQLATSAQARAFQALGINVQAFLHASPDEQMNKLADAVKRATDQGFNPLNAVLQIAGRGAAGLMPILEQGRAGMDSWRQTAVDTGTVIEGKVLKTLDDLGSKLAVAKAAFTNMGAAITALVASPLGELATALGNMAGTIAKLASAGMLGTFAVRSLQYAIQGLFGGLSEEEVSNRIQAMIDKANELYKAAVGGGGTAASKPLPISVGPNREAIAAAQAEFQETISMLKQYRDMYQGTEADLTRMVIQAAEERKEAEIKAGESVVVATAKYNLEVQKAQTDLTRKIMTEWKSVADSISSAFTSQLGAILSGTESFGEGMKKAFASMVEDMIKSLIKLFTEWVTLNAVSMALGGGPIPFSAVMPTLGKFDVGTPFVPQTGLALIHQGEAVIPANNNPFNPNATGAVGGNNISLHVNAADARSVANMFFNNRQFMQQLINTLARNNPSNASRLVGAV